MSSKNNELNCNKEDLYLEVINEMKGIQIHLLEEITRLSSEVNFLISVVLPNIDRDNLNNHQLAMFGEIVLNKRS
ncbi:MULTISPECIES: hypothetical protein [Bacillaceae]|uniref:Uncharacterized protein n=1 Tax=Gottfriedia luciferensis TaxID=178774 RepID=A0ABX2ZZK8_9BACI|nr:MULTISPECIES: hypothetical protein [Bacillaceae]ODG93839.1 hypothetical protein BED47_01325 [Gottfriedia luciferensis]PGZ87379.1 hypothetical protein COE53_21220 [Bacillus sp. AFS029533]SFC29543.1 hypothetical protein SAMN02799633_00349 [Bacillus sp. UNCCL81]